MYHVVIHGTGDRLTVMDVWEYDTDLVDVNTSTRSVSISTKQALFDLLDALTNGRYVEIDHDSPVVEEEN